MSKFTQADPLMLAKNEKLHYQTRALFAVAAKSNSYGYLNATQAELAEMLGVTQQTMSRYMKQLKDAGVLLRQRRRITSECSPMVWRLAPEYTWACKKDHRDKEVSSRRKAPKLTVHQGGKK